jgi:hypothetical protein
MGCQRSGPASQFTQWQLAGILHELSGCRSFKRSGRTIHACGGLGGSGKQGAGASAARKPARRLD